MSRAAFQLSVRCTARLDRDQPPLPLVHLRSERGDERTAENTEDADRCLGKRARAEEAEQRDACDLGDQHSGWLNRTKVDSNVAQKPHSPNGSMSIAAG